MRHARKLWRASAATVMAVWVLQIAITVHVLGVASASTLAVVVFAGTLPMLLMMPVAGTVADRFDVKKVALAAMAVQAVALAGTAVAIAYAPLPVVTGFYALQSAAAAFWSPLRQQWLYGVIEVGNRARANASMGSLNGVMTLLGAAGGGMLSSWSPVAAAGTAALLAASAFTQLAVTRAPGSDRAVPRGGRPGLWADMRDGFQAARDLPLARSVIWAGIAWGFIGGAYTVMLSARVAEGLGGGAIMLGLFFAADGLAVIAGTFVAGRLKPGAHLPVWAMSYVVQGLGWAALFLVPNVGTALACLVLMRLMGGCVIGLDSTILLATVPEGVRGRVTAVHFTTFSAVGRLSLVAVGVSMALVGLSVVGVVTGLLSAVVGVLWWFTAGRRARTAYTHEVHDRSKQTVPAL